MVDKSAIGKTTSVHTMEVEKGHIHRFAQAIGDDNPLYHDLIAEFHRLTGCPVVINTSFNVRGEPIVCTPDDAFRCFLRTAMDYLVMGPFVLDKRQMPEEAVRVATQEVFTPD